MVGHGEQQAEKTTKEITREVAEEITQVARLALEVDKGKRHNDRQDGSGSFEDEVGDGAPS
jgi:hypothetical protein